MDSGQRGETAVLGVGPVGLSAAYVLALRGRLGAVFGREVGVGGAEGVEFGDYRGGAVNGDADYLEEADAVQELLELVLIG